FKLDIIGALKLGAVPVIFIFFFLDLFDSIGSLIGIAEQGGFMRNGQLPRAREALLADAIGTSVSSLLGNSPVVSYIESAAGVAEGGRTGEFPNRLDTDVPIASTSSASRRSEEHTS